MFSGSQGVCRGSCGPTRRARVRAPAKLNLTLRVLGRRSDGYHLLDSLVVPIALFDLVDVQVEASMAAEISVHCSPRGAAPEGPDNLVARAARLYLDRTGRSARIRIDLGKQIPAGAGLGGGSSDAAATLRVLNALSPAPASASDLSRWALELGADVPFFLSGGSARMGGVGEFLEPIEAPIDCGAGLAVVFPGTPLETRHVYANYDDLLTTESAVSRIPRLTVDRGPVDGWLENDLEAAAFRILPIVKDLKRQLRAHGAHSALMTGSGSAVFGIWDGAERASAAARGMRASGLWARATWILNRLPAVETHDGDVGRSPSW